MNSEPHSFDSDPEQLVSQLLTQFHASGTCARDRVARLVQLAASEDKQVAERASRAFFASLVETLADSFEPAAVSLYNQAFAQLVEACRSTRRGLPLDKKLSEFGLLDETAVLARAERIRAGRSSGRPPANIASEVSRVIVLSRVTLGADVAITSVIIERFKIAFPQAEIVLVGGRKASELFGGDPRVAFEEISYPVGADALDRLLAWIPLVERVREITRGEEARGAAGAAGPAALPGEAALAGDGWLIVDPDSRLTQLGLLPLVSEGVGGSNADNTNAGDSNVDNSNVGNSDLSHVSNKCSARYLFFPSREYRSDSSASLSELTSAWLDETLGFASPTKPRLSLNRGDLEAARSLINASKREGHPVITINFGVGGNPSKRVSDDFERRIVSNLLEDGSTTVLDKGAGAEEARRAEDVIEFAKQRSNGSLEIVEIDEDSLSRAAGGDRIEADLVVWSGRIGLLAALIGESDLYIGYDSAGQHIATALGVPCIDVFAGFGSRRMLDRWRPSGRAETRVVVVEQSMTEEEVLARTLRYARELVKSAARS